MAGLWSRLSVVAPVKPRGIEGLFLMFSPRWHKKCSAVWDGRSFCCTMGTSVCSIVTDAKAACGDLVTLCGWTCISLIYLHLEVCFCRFGSEAASVQHRLTGKWIALKEVAISKQCLIVGFFALFLRIHTGLLQKRHLLTVRRISFPWGFKDQAHFSWWEHC